MKASIFVFASALLAAASGVIAQNCGPSYNKQVCAPGKCCSQYGWCDTTDAHCDPANCLQAYSGTGSRCNGTTYTTATTKPSTLSTSTTKITSTTKAGTYASTIPHIDVCGAASNGVSCPGAGAEGFFYRCCSRNGHCGPKNGEQNQADYCGEGCQPGYGDCNPHRRVPPSPPAPHKTSTPNGNCGPIVNSVCPGSSCCSGSNYCGVGTEYCGAANWCQIGWGTCHR